MNVHEAITAHTSKQHAHLQRFLELEEARELAIDRALADAREGRPVQVEAINGWTDLINEHANHGISPTRVHVTEQMIREFALRR